METKLGESEKRFQEKATSNFITPLKAFLEIDIKNVLASSLSLSLSLSRSLSLSHTHTHTHTHAHTLSLSLIIHSLSSFQTQRDKKLLGVKRLDLDAQKNKVKRSQGEALQEVSQMLRL